MIRGILEHKVFFAMAVLMLFLSFALNMFGAVTTDGFVGNFKDSEALVVNQVRCQGDLYANQLLERNINSKTTDGQCSTSDYQAYSSQFGLQGKIATAIFEPLTDTAGISAPMFVALLQMFTALLSAVLLALFVLWVRTRFGLTVAIVTLGMVTLSPMLVGFARNLYWALPLLLAPIVYCLYFFKAKADLRRAVMFYCGLGLLLYLRYLCGYEYITTITIMVFAIAVFHLTVGGSRRTAFLTHAITIGSVSVVAFILALLTHVGAISVYTGSPQASVSIIQKRAEERTLNADKYLEYAYANLKGLAPDHYKITDTYVHYDQKMETGSKVWGTFVAASTYLLLPIIHTPLSLSPPFGQYIQSMGALCLVLLALYVTRTKWSKGKTRREVVALYRAIVVGLIGYVSWLVIAFSHSLVHAHINGILMYLPTALIGFIVIGLYLEFLIKKYATKK